MCGRIMCERRTIFSMRQSSMPTLLPAPSNSDIAQEGGFSKDVRRTAIYFSINNDPDDSAKLFGGSVLRYYFEKNISDRKK